MLADFDRRIGGNEVAISDDGPGFPVQVNPESGERAFLLLTILFACRLARKHEGVAERFCDVGLAVANAFAAEFHIETVLGPERLSQSFSCGRAATPLTSGPVAASARGTWRAFRIDPTIFGALRLSAADLEARAARLRGDVPTCAFDLRFYSELPVTTSGPRCERGATATDSRLSVCTGPAERAAHSFAPPGRCASHSLTGRPSRTFHAARPLIAVPQIVAAALLGESNA